MRRAANRVILKNLIPFFIVLAVLAAELLISNFPYFAFIAGKDYGRNISVPDQVFELDAERLNAGISFTPCALDSVSFTVFSAGDEDDSFLCKVTVYSEETGSPGTYRAVTTKEIAVTSVPEKKTIYIDTVNKAAGLMLGFSEAGSGMTVSDLVANPDYTPRFSTVRFSVILLAAMLVYMLFFTPLGKKVKSWSFGNVAFITVVVCLCGALIVSAGYLPEYREVRDFRQDDIESENPYIQQMDAFIKGQLYIDVEPSEELKALENPYDAVTRGDAHYLWDRAYYEGRYYSYFGTAPIFTVYYPFYKLTGGLPCDSLVTGIFTLLVSLFLPLAVMFLLKYIDPSLNPWFAALAAVGALGASMIFIVRRGVMPFYYIASCAGMAFASMALCFLVIACTAKNRIGRAVLFALSGISFALCIHSRLNSALPAGFIAAAVLAIRGVKAIKEKNIGVFAAELAAFCVPVIAGIAAAGWYNYVRFSSPLEFGTSYQLTVADTSTYSLSLSGIIPTIYYYFLKPFVPDESFPFISMSQLKIPDYGKYIYNDVSLGVFAMPFSLALFGAIPLLKSKKTASEKKLLLSAALISIALTAFADLCLGGIIFRYTADISMICALTSAGILMELYSLLRREKKDQLLPLFKKGSVLLCFFGTVTAFASSLSLNANLSSYLPEVYEDIRSFFVFWN